jgi:exopolysaccharide biosynthesis polyprenyl glycosylphosphotransferase
LIGYSERLYQSRTIESPRNERLTIGKCIFWSTFLVGVIFSGSALRLAAGACINSLFLFARREWRREHTSNVAAARETTNVIIIGSGTTARRVADHLSRLHFERRAVLGFVDDGVTGDGILGSVQDLAYLVKSNFIDEIIVAGAQPEVALRAIAQARQCGVGVRVVPEFFGIDPRESAIRTLGDIPILTLRTESIPKMRQAVKRAVDVTCAAFGLLLLAPLLAGIAAWICWDSSGPILYKAQRVGFKGRRFACYKFRTMVANADSKKEELRARNERQGASFKIHDDPRITRIGRVLRRYSLDELPQMWNILRGEMSLVGPRPHPLDDFARYGLDDLGRLLAIPGLTGLWQVTARQDPSFERNVALDREYIEHWSLAADFRIMAKTISAVLHGSGN